MTQSNMSIAARDGAEEVVRRADAHQVARPVCGQVRHGDVERREHRRLALADREAADRVALEADRGQRVGGSRAQVRDRRCPGRCRTGRSRSRGTNAAAAARGPAHRQLHRLARAVLRWPGTGCTRRSAMVMVASSRCWISIERSGVRRCSLPSRCERKVTPSASSLRSSGQRHDLEAAAIGQDRARPVHEAVQPAEPRDALGAGPQHQVVGVAEHDAGAGRAHRVGGHRLDRAGGADRHEDRRRARRRARCAACRRGRRRRCA